ncbi:MULTISPECIES: DUF2017 family protein [Microbacterium]|uniref:DUF2017 family protein n=1 Tax=Microbacterium saccharophilum TaxID=1213358 RepID=A0A7Z7GCE6_9MICO|nr:MULTISPECIES: DUF2017 family protein [Microbacterium]SFI29058.1 protein of unknown function [Microbacterium saccharophilum]
MTVPGVALELTAIEVAHLTSLVEQFSALVTEQESDAGDPAIARLVPDAYADADAAREFRALTESDLLQRRAADAGLVLATLLRDGAPLRPEELDAVSAEAVVSIPLDGERLSAWLRTLTALRLVLATRLGIRTEADGDVDDPRYGVYEWLGYRLEGLLQAIDG